MFLFVINQTVLQKHILQKLQIKLNIYMIYFNIKNFIFGCTDFSVIMQEATDNDIIYCDPPYINRHTDYFTTWNEEHEYMLYNILSQTKF